MLPGRSLSCLSVTLVYCDQTVGWPKMKLGTDVGLGPGHIVFGGDSAPLPKRGTAPQFWAHVCCGQTTGWIKTPLQGTEVDHGPGDIALDGDPAPPKRWGTAPPIFAHVLWPNSCMDQDAAVWPQYMGKNWG